MTNRRCISCEQSKDKDEFNSTNFRFCKTCERHATSDELRYFENIFLDCGQELFCLEYPDAKSQLGVSIPSDNEGIKKMLENIKKRVEDKTQFWLEQRDNSDSSSKTYREAEVSLHQLKFRKAEVIDFQQKYNK